MGLLLDSDGIKRSQRIKKLYEEFTNFILDLDIKILPLELNVADTFIDLKINLEKKGKRLEDFDLIIGSTAIINGLTLVTNNTKHFSRIPKIQLYSKQ